MTIIIALIAFGIMIAVHEAGHLIAAKLSGVLVHEFAIGMGPKIFSWQGKETKYSLRLLPIGGFCSLEGEDSESESDRAFCNAKPLNKLIILASGAIMNIILGFVVLGIFYSFQPQIAEPVVAGVLEQTYAEQIGIKNGDRIVKMGNTRINIYPDLKFFMLKNGDKPFDLTIERNNEIIVFEDFHPTQIDNQNIIGINVLISDNTFIKTLKNSFYMSIFMGKLVIVSLYDLVTGEISINETSGPVGIVNEIGSAAKSGFSDLLYIVALITINLGLFNLLPLPALDGGRILFVLISIIIRRKVPEKIEAIFHTAGMLLLMLLVIFVTYNDIIKLFVR